ncbi:MAG TPA: hypothetical protein VGF28_14180 [Thermoanaerobaculia bacterium]|jgi:hypothetical protein
MRHPLRVAIAFALASTAVRLYLAHRYFGFQTGDDVEIAEEAFRRALGLVFWPWEVRNLFLPDLLVAPFVALGHALGVRDTFALAQIARYPFIALAGVNVVLLFLLGRRWYGDAVALTAAALYSMHWIPLVYGSSLYPRTFAVTCILGAAILLSRESTTATRAVLAGVLAGLAVTARYSEAVYFFSLVLYVASRRKALAGLTCGFAGTVVLAVGLYDRVTYGRWFGSLIEFAELTFIRRDAASLVVFHPPWWYLTNLPHWLPLALLPGFVIAVRTEWRRAAIFVGLPLLALSAIFHKELRYLQVVVPFAILISVHGLWSVRHRRRLVALLLVLAIPLGLTRIREVTKRSTNAAAAAIWIGARQPRSVALSQSWAYGGRMFLANDVVTYEVGIPPDPATLRKEAPSLTVLAVYAHDASRALRAICAQHGLYETATFSGRGGRAVVVFTARRAASRR